MKKYFSIPLLLLLVSACITVALLAGETESYTVSVTDGTVSYEGSTGASQENIPRGSTVILTATAPEGKVFSHWIDANGRIAALTSPYEKTVICDLAWTPVFVTEGETPSVEPVIYADLVRSGSDYTLQKHFVLPLEAEVLHHGVIFLYGDHTVKADAMTLTAVQSNAALRTVYHTATEATNFTTENTVPDEGVGFSARAFVVYSVQGTTYTLYSEVVHNVLIRHKNKSGGDLGTPYYILAGEDATHPTPPTVTDYTFAYWKKVTAQSSAYQTVYQAVYSSDWSEPVT